MILGLVGPARMALCLLLFTSQLNCTPFTSVPNTNRVDYHIGDLYCINESYCSAKIGASNKEDPYHCGWEAVPEATVQCTSSGKHVVCMHGDIYASSAPSMCTCYSLRTFVSSKIKIYVPML